MPAAGVVLGLKGNLFLIAVSAWWAFEDGTGDGVPRPGSASQRFSNEGILRRKSEWSLSNLLPSSSVRGLFDLAASAMASVRRMPLMGSFVMSNRD